MSNWAIIDKTNTVINIADWDGKSKWSPPDGCVIVQSDTCNIGDLYVKGLQTFINPKSNSAEVNNIEQFQGDSLI